MGLQVKPQRQANRLSLLHQLASGSQRRAPPHLDYPCTLHQLRRGRSSMGRPPTVTWQPCLHLHAILYLVSSPPISLPRDDDGRTQRLRQARFLHGTGPETGRCHRPCIDTINGFNAINGFTRFFALPLFPFSASPLTEEACPVLRLPPSQW